MLKGLCGLRSKGLNVQQLCAWVQNANVPTLQYNMLHRKFTRSERIHSLSQSRLVCGTLAFEQTVLHNMQGSLLHVCTCSQSPGDMQTLDQVEQFSVSEKNISSTNAGSATGSQFFLILFTEAVAHGEEVPTPLLVELPHIRLLENNYTLL